MKRYFGLFKNYTQMMNEWGSPKSFPIPEDKEILFAHYEYEDYYGYALVIFEHGKLYEVNGTHCSCYGLSEVSYRGESESQWKPEETTWKALELRKPRLPSKSEEALRKLITRHTTLVEAK